MNDDKTRRIKATYYTKPYYQAHKPTNDAPDNPKHDLIAVFIAVGVLLVIFFLASVTAGTPVY